MPRKEEKRAQKRTSLKFGYAENDFGETVRGGKGRKTTSEMPKKYPHLRQELGRIT